MRFFIKSVSLLALVAVQPNIASARTGPDWKVNEEREISPSLYMKLVAELNGWRIWREEGASSKNCSAVKPANGVAQPQPYSSTVFFHGFPALVISETTVMDKQRIDWRLLGTYLRPSIEEFRVQGERFFTRKPDLFADPTEWQKITDYDNKTIEVHVGSWKYPAISVGFSENTGMINLVGMSEAIEAVKTCNASKG